MGMNRTLENRRANTLVSKAANGNRVAWWETDENDTESHYEGFIPLEDVENKLLFDVETVPLFADIPTTDTERATDIDGNGDPVIRVPVENKIAVVRTDTNEVLGINGDGYVIHDYADNARNVAHNLTGETLGCVSAGLLRNGAQFWSQFAHEYTVKDDLTGIDFRSFITFSTSLDGSLATQFNIATCLAVCENTFSIARGQGLKFRRKHTVNSAYQISDVAQALDLIDRTDEAFINELHYLTEMEITDKQLELFMSQWAPLPDEAGRGRTRAENKRDKFYDLYRNNDMCSDWQGTGFGVLQTANTFEHYLSEVRGGNRDQRVRENIVTGKMAQKDSDALKYLLVATA